MFILINLYLFVASRGLPPRQCSSHGFMGCCRAERHTAPHLQLPSLGPAVHQYLENFFEAVKRIYI